MANLSLDINSQASQITSNTNIPCTMLNPTLIQLNNNRPISTSTPITQMTVKTQKTARFTPRTFQQQTPVMKNPNRNKKVKDLILDLRIQQQQNQVQEQQQQEQQQVQLQTQQIQQQHQQQQYQYTQQHIYEPPSPQQFQQQQMHQNHVNPNNTNTTNTNNNDQNTYPSQFNNNNNYLIDNNDAYIVNDSKLITLNRLNNESESMTANSGPQLTDLLNMSNPSHAEAFNYMLDNSNTTLNNNNLESISNNNQQQQQQTVINNMNANCGSNFINVNHDQQQFEHYNQQQMILEENNAEADSNHEEYLIFNLLNKIANSTNTDKLLTSMLDEEDKVNIIMFKLFFTQFINNLICLLID